MIISWKNTLFDRVTLIVSLMLLVLPSLLYSWSVVTVVRSEKLKATELIVQNSIYEIETLMDHINGALISLVSIELDCTEKTIQLMHELSFELIGVEAFYVLDNEGNVLCTDWLNDFSTFNTSIHQERPGINFSGEIYFPKIGRTGVYVYRKNASDYFVGSLVASAFFRQILNQGVPAGDTLAFYNRFHDMPMAINGIISTANLIAIKEVLRSPSGAVQQVGSQRVTLARASEQYSDLIAAYTYKQETLTDILGSRLPEITTIFSLSMLVFIGWFNLRHRILSSYQYQISRALKHEEFTPYFQPIVDMSTGEWIGAEVLARWHRSGAVVANPDEFIAKAEKYNLLKPITRQIAAKAFAELEVLLKNHPEFYFTVNLSPNQIDQITVNFIMASLANHKNILPKNIRFEITEQGLADVNKERFRETIEYLRSQGFSFGLDDFGAGQSGLEYFNNITPDFLKIDRRFVSAISFPESVDFQILVTILQLAQKLDLVIIAEGVETRDQQQWLLQHDIRCGQGWLYHKPMSEEDIHRKMCN